LKNENCWYKSVCTYDYCTNCIRYAEMKYLMDSSGIPKNRQKPKELIAGSDYDAFYKLNDVKEKIDEYVNIGGFNLYICSENTGNGKTSWAIKILLKYFDKIWAGNGFRVRGMFVHVPTLLAKLKDFDHPDPSLKTYRENLNNADLVVWDDIAGAKLSDYDISQLLMIIDSRIIDDKTNIYTSNVITQTDLSKAVGPRLASRIFNCSAIIELKGTDRRHGSFTDIK